LESNIQGVYAGGDSVYAPILDTAACIGHWQLAHYHGRIAALNMVGKQTEIQTVPFFWTMLFGKGVRYAGTVFSNFSNLCLSTLYCMATLLKLQWILDTISPSTVDTPLWHIVLVTKSTNESLLLTLLDACIIHTLIQTCTHIH